MSIKNDGAAESYLAARRELRGHTRSRFVVIAVMGVYFIACAPWMAWSMVSAPIDGGWRTDGNRSVLEAISSVLFGRLSATDCLAAVGILLALVATINVALAARPVVLPAALLADRFGAVDREQLRESNWRRQLALIALLAGSAALFCAAAGWTDSKLGERAGVAVLTSGLTLLTMYLAAAVHDDTQNAADQALQREEIRQDLDKIKRRRRRLPLALRTDAGGPRRIYLALAGRVTLIVFLQVLVCLAALEVIAFSRRGHFVKIWATADPQAVLIVAFGAGLMVLALMASLTRWSSYASEGSVWKFKVWPYLGRTGYALGSGLFSTLVLIGTGLDVWGSIVVAATFFIAMFSGPVAIWFGCGVTASRRLARLSQRWWLARAIRGVLWFGMRPFWGIVVERLDGREKFLLEKAAELRAIDAQVASRSAYRVAASCVPQPSPPVVVSMSRDWVSIGTSAMSLVAMGVLARRLRK
ncbi:hypothetical protein [Tsukamurella strandjordii]|uniref:Uncharacterized protein n=1 Tax=Tsukamurella strandjordii TaxID=147577 RepID=A0AA90NI42_9ACTN|nr:hypothetical protein [Tsukamurella strandjordii]MDP0398771.1 hypothetical protein [Tsukamurella strandjordii]